MTPSAHLNSLEYVPEHRALLPLVDLGSVLVAVGGESGQLITQLIPLLKLVILEGDEERIQSPNHKQLLSKNI